MEDRTPACSFAQTACRAHDDHCAEHAHATSPDQLPEQPAAAPLAVESIAVQPDRLVLTVRVAPGAPRFMDDALAKRLDALRPSLKMHACVNDVGPSFGHVMATTSIPHALEHLILDEQVRDEAAPDAFPFSGITLWLDEGVGLAHIEVSYFDDLTALAAVRTATTLLCDCLAGAVENEPGR